MRTRQSPPTQAYRQGIWLVGLFEPGSGGLVGLFDAGQRREVWSGTPGEPMTVHPVHKVRVMRDGGSTSYETAAGALFVPVDGGPGKQATWLDEPLSPVEPRSYAVDVMSGTISVVR